MWRLATLAAVTLALGVGICGNAGAKTVLVAFDRGVTPAQEEQIIDAAGGRLTERFPGIHGGRLTVAEPRRKLAAALLIRRLSKRSTVDYAELDSKLVSSAKKKTPDDPLYPTQYALGDGNGDHDIDAPQTWKDRTGCAKVAVLDTGVDLDHPDLKKNIVTTDDKPKDGIDNDGNGYIDDVHGFDAIKGKGSGNDANGHGTHVAGIIGANGDNDKGVAGLCWKATIVPIRFLDENGGGSTSDALAGVVYAIHEGVRIINCSFGGDTKSEALHDAVRYANQEGVLMVVAAGNDGRNIDKKPSYPASFDEDNLLVVAATDDQDKLTSFSNWGKTDVDVAAPGDLIRSTWLKGKYEYSSGTSMSTPYVAAVAAMLLKAKSDASPSKLRKTIKKSADDIGALKDKVASGGRLSARRALNMIND